MCIRNQFSCSFGGTGRFPITIDIYTNIKLNINWAHLCKSSENYILHDAFVENYALSSAGNK